MNRLRIAAITTALLGALSLGSVFAQGACDFTVCAPAGTFLPLVLVNEPPPSPTPEPPPLPATLAIRSATGAYRSSSSYYVVGEVANGTSANAYFVQITGRFYNEAGQLVATDDGYTLLTRTRPGMRNPFRVIVFNPPPGITRFELTLSSQTRSGLVYQPVTVLNQQTRDNFGLEVFGELRNDHIKPLRNIQAAATFYDASGDVIDVDTGVSSPADVPIGGISTYSIKTFDDNLAPATILVQAEGYE